MKKNIIITIAVLLATVSSLRAQEFINPSIKSKSTFAIIVDKLTFEAVEEELMAYKNSVEKDGLGTYIIFHNWSKPEQIKNILFKLYSDQKQPLEGAVFVGEIPIPMIRGAQLLTSAFKMNEEIGWHRSSVPSDRFYDDFDLKFDFLKQEEDLDKGFYFYYDLASDSPHQLSIDIYTGRIKPPHSKNKSSEEQIREYLDKLVKIREEDNTLDHMIASTGHGYNSNSTISSSQEVMALRTSFPELFTYNNSIKFLNYQNTEFIKFNLLTELKRDDLDFAFMTGHGTSDLQLLSGFPDVSSPHQSMINVSRYIRSKMNSAKEKGKDLEIVKAGYQESLGLNEKWFDDAFNRELKVQDSIYNINMDINSGDIKGINARVAYLNSCLTGSFHKNDYLAGYYPFNDGKNIVAIANSVGVLQDLWGIQLLGILKHGARVGHLLKKTAYLETHVFGDPTYHFKSQNSQKLNYLLANKSSTTDEWYELLSYPDADLQALALMELFKIEREQDFSKTLVEYYKKSPYESVRTQAYLLLRTYNGEDFKTVLTMALSDNYEYIRRKALYDVADVVDDRYISAIVDIYFHDQEFRRSQYKINWILQFYNYDKMLEAFQDKDVSGIYNGEELREAAIKKVKYEKSKNQKVLDVLTNSESTEKELQSEIRTFRLYRRVNLVPSLLNLINDDRQSNKVKLEVVETLSWFGMSSQRGLIESRLHEISKITDFKPLKDEINKTLNALRDASSRSF